LVSYSFTEFIPRREYLNKEATYLLLNKSKSFNEVNLRFEVSIEATKSNWKKLYKKNFDISNYPTNSLLDPTFKFNDMQYLDIVIALHQS